MALVAFDLDSTLGTFYAISAWAHCFSVETLENSVFRAANPGFSIDPDLRRTLARTEDRFIRAVLESPVLLEAVLRPNLDAIFRPLLQAHAHGKLRAVIMISNTWNTFSMRLAKELIETLYQCPGLFCALVDATHSIRIPDWRRVEHGEPVKTYRGLRAIFRTLCGVRSTIRPSDIIFIDERIYPHDVRREVQNGLTYIQPSEYSPVLSEAVRREIRRVGYLVLEREGLLRNPAYLASGLCFCIKVAYDLTLTPITSIVDLLAYVETAIQKENRVGISFKDDSVTLRRKLIHALSKF